MWLTTPFIEFADLIKPLKRISANRSMGFGSPCTADGRVITRRLVIFRKRFSCVEMPHISAVFAPSYPKGCLVLVFLVIQMTVG